MPTVDAAPAPTRKKKGARAPQPIVDADDQVQQALEYLDADNKQITDAALLHADWLKAVMDPALSFFDALTEIPQGAWGMLTVYLYRLDPKIQNREGEGKYIECLGSVLTEEMVQKKHGGGKYEAWLKAGRTTLKRHRFWIDGEPIIQAGQILRGAGTTVQPGAAIAPNEDSIAKIVTAVIAATKGDSSAANAGIEVMKKAMMDGLELTSTIANKRLESTTGSGVGDKLFEALLPRLLAPPQTDPILLELAKAAISNMKSDRRENPEPTKTGGIASELTLLKELTGVESLRELMDLGGQTKAQPWWVTIVTNAIEKLPAVISQVAEMQQRGFERAVMAHQLGAGGRPLAAPPNMIPTGQAPLAAPAPGAPDTAAKNFIEGIVNGIARAFDDGYPGDMAAVHIKLSYPELIDQVRPLLADPARIQELVNQMPPLAERSTDPEWPAFVAEFIEEMRQVQEDAPQPPAPGPIAVPQATPPSGTRKAPTKKQSAPAPTPA
jgi:hypothetical protein